MWGKVEVEVRQHGVDPRVNGGEVVDRRGNMDVVAAGFVVHAVDVGVR